MRILKRKYIDRFCMVALLALLIFGDTTLLAQETSKADDELAKTMYLQAYSLTSRANGLRDNREFSKALELYQGASDIYGIIIKKHPDWKSDVVAELNKDTTMQIAVIKRIMSSEVKQKAPDPKVPESVKSTAKPKPEPVRTDPVSKPKPKPDPAVALNAEIEKLNLDNKELRRMVERLKKVQEQLVTENKQKIRARIEPLLTENEELRKRLESVNDGEELLSDKSMSEKIVSLTKENLALNEQLTDALSKIRDLRAKDIGFAKLGENYEKAMKENRELREREKAGYTDLLDKQKEVWRQKFEDLQSAKNDSEKATKVKIEQLVKDLEKAHAKVKSGYEVIEEVKANNAKLRGNLSELKDYEKLLPEMKDLRGRLEDMASEHNDEIKKAEAKWSERLAKVEKRSEDRLERAAAENQDLKDSFSKREKAWNDEHDRLIAVMDEEYSELAAERDQLKEKLDDLSDAAKLIQDQKNEIDALVKKAKEYNAQQKNAIEERDAMWAERVKQAGARVGEELESTRADLIAAKDRIQNMDADWQQRQSDLKEQWRDKFQNLAAELKARDSEIAAQKTELAKMKDLFEQSKAGELANAFREQQEKHAEQVKVLRDAVDSLKIDRDTLSDENFKMEARLMELERRYKDLLKKLKSS